MPKMKGINNAQVADSNQRDEPHYFVTRPSNDPSAELEKKPSIMKKRVSISNAPIDVELIHKFDLNNNPSKASGSPRISKNNSTAIIDRNIIENIERSREEERELRNSRKNSRASKASQSSYLQHLNGNLEESERKSRLSNDLEYGPSPTSEISHCPTCVGGLCCYSRFQDDPAHCRKQCIDYSLLFSILCLFIVTFIGYIIILGMADSSTGEDNTTSSEFSGYVPMPNLNKTIEGAPYYESSFNENQNETIMTTREFWMQCKYSDGADRFMFSCIQLDEHFVLKSKSEMEVEEN